MMCLIGIALDEHPDFPFMLWSNRDEFYERPTTEIHLQKAEKDMIAGKDLRQGGTWLGITPDGFFAALTNVRPMPEMNGARSRGELIPSYIFGRNSEESIIANKHLYNGFNFLYGSLTNGVGYISNQHHKRQTIDSGIHGISNGDLNEPWPKVNYIKEKMRESAVIPGNDLLDFAFSALADTKRADKSQLPDTGVGEEMEKILSSAFIKSSTYGTRCSTVLLLDRFGYVTFSERSYVPSLQTITYHFPIIK